jgi:hypothetical protein
VVRFSFLGSRIRKLRTVKTSCYCRANEPVVRFIPTRHHRVVWAGVHAVRRAVIGKRYLISSVDDSIGNVERGTHKGAVAGVNAAHGARRTYAHTGPVKLGLGSVIFEICLCKGDGTSGEDKGGNCCSVFKDSEPSRQQRF